ncbi:MAG: UTP--glucose-1-phosphate uridylyltransferase [Coriobacteriales bacterium]|nr:UTP--glucose-1-phosphate uridylyltransferase [Coriobacteriales bacterium]
MKAIIPAAGLGTRFLPASKAIPKEMLPVLERPAIQYVVEEALAAAASEVIIICNDDKPELVAHFSPSPDLERSLHNRGKDNLAAAVRHAGGLPVSFTRQGEPLGLGHAVHCAADLVRDERFYVLLGDVLVPDNRLLARMRSISDKYNGASVIAVWAVPDEEVSRFGVIDGELVSGVPLSERDGSEGTQDDPAVWLLNTLVEKPALKDAPSNLAAFGRYLLTPTVMSILAHTAPGAGGEIQLTDALVELMQSEEVYALEVGPDEGFDCGTVADWLDTNIRLALRDPALNQRVRQALAPS